MQDSGPIRPRKSLGQHFLRDNVILERIVRVAALAPADRVLEIGPGLGHLTRLLQAQAGEVLAIELDERLVPLLDREFGAGGTVRIVHGDALAYPYASLGTGWKAVANLPYYISSPLIRRLLAARTVFRDLTLMLQREVAERITAGPGSKDYGYLSALVQRTAIPRIEFIVPAGAFFPPPEVDSAVVTIVVPVTPPVPVRNEQTFLQVLRAAFSQRRKTLRNSLKQLGLSADTLGRVGAEAGIDLGRRPETLSVAEFGRLADLVPTLSNSGQE